MTDWSSKTVEQLKIELRSRGIGVSGNKSILVERLAMSEKKSEILENLKKNIIKHFGPGSNYWKNLKLRKKYFIVENAYF